MATESATPEPVQPEPVAKEVSSPAPSAKPDEHMIPKSRLDEVIAARDKAEKELQKFQAAEEKRKKEEMTELDRLKLEKQEAEDKAKQAEEKLKEETIKHTVFTEAGKAQFGEKKQRFIDAEVVYLLLSDEDKAGDIIKALNKLAKEKPFLLEQVQSGDGVGSPKKGKPNSQEEKQPVYKIPHF